jgi:hypothetical protein
LRNISPPIAFSRRVRDVFNACLARLDTHLDRDDTARLASYRFLLSETLLRASAPQFLPVFPQHSELNSSWPRQSEPSFSSEDKKIGIAQMDD